MSDLDNISLGMLLDILSSLIYNDSAELDEKYQKLKSIESIVEQRYKSGEISKRKYDDFKAALREYEEA